MKKTQLFCITYAGGNAGFFQNLIERLETDMECHALEYAGHGTRRKEPCYENLDALLDEIHTMICKQRNPDVPYIIFGYSMGSMVVYELLRRYFADDMPQHVYLAAHEPPHIPSKGHDYALLDDAGFITAMLEFGGIDARMTKNQRFLDIYLPPMRADYQYIHDYVWDEKTAKIPGCATVFYSPTDTKRSDIEQWQLLFEGRVRLCEFEGGHFFLRNHIEEIVDIIRGD